jgi:anti-sigma factor RsiW/sugar lactone lactonase YvrE
VEATQHCSPETLSALFDGELSLAEHAAARAHISRCSSCTAELAAFGKIEAELQDTSSVACSAVLTSLSALVDGEVSSLERAIAETHLIACAGCRSLSAGLKRADALIAALPKARPSASVDAAIAALGGRARDRGSRRLPPIVAWRAVAAIALIVAITLGSTFLPANAPLPQQAGIAPSGALVAGQHVVFDERTNTLYLLNTQRADVTAVDPTTQTERTRIDIGGTPSALALSSFTNRVLVLDATTKRLTEIDTASNSVIGVSTLDVSGTLTSMQVDATGRIIVASVVAQAVAAPTSTAAIGAATGHVTVLDAVTKQVETVTAVDVAPQLVILDAKGSQALLLSTDATTLVDAATYKSIVRLPAGVAAAFDATGRAIAVLSADGDASKVSFRGEGLPASLSLPGRPLSLIAMPNGGFAALVDRGASGEVAVIDATGRLVSSSPVTASGHNLTYNAGTARFAVGGDSTGALTFTTAAVAAASPSSAPTSTSVATKEPSATPTPSPSPSALAGDAVNAAPIGPLLPPGQLASADTFRVALSDSRRPMVVAGAGRTLWFIDQSQRLASIDTVTAVVTDLAQLTPDATHTRLLVGSRYLYAVDQAHGRVEMYSLRTGQLETVGFPFAASAGAFSVGLDDRLWIAGDSPNVLSLDPNTKGVTAVDFRVASIGALFADTAGRVWYADGAGGIGYYDQSNRALVAVPTPNRGPVTALNMDSDGSLWIGTRSGELLSVRFGVVRLAGSAGGSVAGLVRDPSGSVWSYAVAPGAFIYRSLSTGAGARVAAGSASSLAFDSLGRPWLGDGEQLAFYIVLKGAQ